MRHREYRIRKAMMFVLAISITGIFWNMPLSAQFTTARLDGTVLDASGGLVPDAQVTAQNTDTGFKEIVATGPAGAFLFPRLPVGNYRLTVEKPGFFKYVQDGITLTVNQAASQVVTLQVGEVTQAVTVAADAELVTTGTAAVGQLIDTRRILDLPLNGRQAQSLVLLSVGTADVTNQNCGFNCNGGVYPGEQYASSSGGGPNGTNYQVDGNKCLLTNWRYQQAI